tara:strand:+ start:99 stop:335 length:237 start_codon:yes stop_codon:yes gene_type:complete
LRSITLERAHTLRPFVYLLSRWGAGEPHEGGAEQKPDTGTDEHKHEERPCDNDIEWPEVDIRVASISDGENYHKNRNR